LSKSFGKVFEHDALPCTKMGHEIFVKFVFLGQIVFRNNWSIGLDSINILGQIADIGGSRVLAVIGMGGRSEAQVGDVAGPVGRIVFAVESG